MLSTGEGLARRVLGFDGLITELDGHIIKHGIITFVSAGMTNVEIWDVKRKKKNGKLFFGTSRRHNLLFPVKFVTAIAQGSEMSLVVRSFTEEYDDETGLPIKELRGYTVWLHDEIGERGEKAMRVYFRMISAKDMAHASNTDAVTGEPLKPEEAVIYCGPNGDYLDTDLRRINR